MNTSLNLMPLQQIELKTLRNLKALMLDVDGILTDGRLSMDAPGQWRRSFHIHDGIGIKNLIETGIKVAWITGSHSLDIAERAKNLGVESVFQGIESKLPVAEKFLFENNLQWSDSAYMGDDLPDLPVLQKVGCPVTVPNAHEMILKQNHFYITSLAGGHGAVRELCDLILKSRTI